MSADTIALLVKTIALSGDTIALLVETITLLGKTIALLVETITLLGKTIALSGDTIALLVDTIISLATFFYGDGLFGSVRHRYLQNAIAQLDNTTNGTG
ncbi:hypothetical protein NIES4072_19900 [Nostoc commune NIES-4072]|uniref:Uncharacterized protein n=1 Tax=Nostoc commune NIES-4072 TaxID=2005467 RepID=A0A2R5FI08_NOSCO|nr:hypothetical protein [Nostoc commune]BBD64347.1 hypothetical protein NIES4070_06900 [Nostoc commune HK-02]GBG18326.1 hypothetical protein NIES4072_19900 [Nostoc commune NIES-4072]